MKQAQGAMAVPPLKTVRPKEYSLTLEADGYLRAVVGGVSSSLMGKGGQVRTADVPVKLYAGDVKNGDGKINIIDISLAPINTVRQAFPAGSLRIST